MHTDMYERMTYDEICQDVRLHAYEHWTHVLTALETGAKERETVMGLPFSSSWLFATGRHCRWCLDPAPRVALTDHEYETLARTLAAFDFCIISHLHGDHFDARLLRLMSEAGHVTFVLPETIAEALLADVPLPPQRVRIIPCGRVFEHDGISLTVLPGLHDEPGTSGFPSSSFLIELPDGMRLAFPIDVRDYSHGAMPAMQNAHILFAHLWLGRNVSHLDTFPLLDDFCKYCLSYRPRTIILGHLHEVARLEDSMWTDRHARLVTERLHAMAPDIAVVAPPLGSVQSLRDI